MERFGYLLNLSDAVQSLIRASSNKPITEMNFIEAFNPNEPQISRLLEMLLSYRDRGGDLYIFRLFAQKFLEPRGFDISDIKRPEIHREEKHIDLWVIEHGKYAIIFENKLKGADFRRNQLARYIQTMRVLGYSDEQIFVVILPKNTDFEIDWIRDSVWKCPQDALTTTNSKRRCGWKDSVSCWCDCAGEVVLNKRDIRYCEKCEQSLRQEFAPRTVILKTDFSAWLIEAEQKIEPRERNVRSAILQFADYLDSLYNNKLNILMKREIESFLNERLNPSQDKDGWLQLRDRLKEVEELKQGIERVRYEISRCLIDKWYENLKDKWPGMEYEPHNSFGYIIDKRIWVGCKFYYDDENHYDKGDDGQPFWGFIRIDNKEPSQTQVRLVERIMAQCDDLVGKGKWDDRYYIVWDNTLNGDIRYDALFKAAKKMGLL